MGKRRGVEPERPDEQPTGLFTVKGFAVGCVVIGVVVLIVWISTVVISTWKEPLLPPPG